MNSMNSQNQTLETTWQSPDAAQTHAWGIRLGEALRPGDLLCLYGDLGTGKTLFTQGIGQALGVTEPVTSPTFTMIQQYQTALATHTAPTTHTALAALVHMDLYRLREPAEADIIGVWDTMRNDTIVVVEWPEIIAQGLPPDRYELHMTGSGESPRELRLVCLGAVRRLDSIIAGQQNSHTAE
jgi:tRNA threonylcarbamoyladenosine biosynthesis protein TsaE